MNEARYAKPASNLNQSKRPSDVGLNYRSGLVDAPVDVRFGGEMDNSIATVHRGLCCCGVANVALNELIAGMVRNRMEIREIASVRELVVVNDRVIFSGLQNIADEIRAYETRAAADKDLHRAVSLLKARSLGSPLDILFAPVSATRLLALKRDSKVPASVHQPSRIS